MSCYLKKLCSSFVENALSWNETGTFTPTVNLTALMSYINNGNDLELDLDQYDESLNGTVKLIIQRNSFCLY